MTSASVRNRVDARFSTSPARKRRSRPGAELRIGHSLLAQMRSGIKKDVACSGTATMSPARAKAGVPPVESSSCAADLYRRDRRDDEYDPSIRQRSCGAWSHRSIGPARPLDDIHLAVLGTTGFTAPLAIRTRRTGTTFRLRRTDARPNSSCRRSRRPG